jgi:uncharacterized membrane protein YcaP (DUF421 family)
MTYRMYAAVTTCCLGSVIGTALTHSRVTLWQLVYALLVGAICGVISERVLR